MSVNKEKWIDLFCLIQSVYHENGMAHFIYDCDVPHLVHNQTYLLRKAVREVGFKIKRVLTHSNNGLSPHILEYHTNIPEALWKTKWQFWSEWNEEACEYYVTSDSDTETDSESDEENEGEDDDPL
jgi:hypothetical protein